MRLCPGFCRWSAAAVIQCFRPFWAAAFLDRSIQGLAGCFHHACWPALGVKTTQCGVEQGRVGARRVVADVYKLCMVGASHAGREGNALASKILPCRQCGNQDAGTMLPAFGGTPRSLIRLRGVFSERVGKIPRRAVAARGLATSEGQPLLRVFVVIVRLNFSCGLRRSDAGSGVFV